MQNIFTPSEVAKICQTSPREVCRWCDRGDLKHYKIPGTFHRRITREYLDEFLAQHPGVVPVESYRGDA